MYGPNIVPLSEILTKRLAEIDWGPEYDSIGSSELLKDGAQVILHRTHAIGLCILQLACESACAAFECVIIEVYPLYLESIVLQSLSGPVDGLRSVPFLAGISVDNKCSHNLRTKFIHIKP